MFIEELGIEISPLGRKVRDLGPVEIVRELVVDDLALLTKERGVQKYRRLLNRVTERHHSLARCLASGMKNWESAIVTGYTPAAISLLKGDPTFRELVRFYSDKTDAVYADMHKHLAGMSIDAAVELRERMEKEPETLSAGQLMELIKLGADRTGYGPATTQTQLNIHVNMADRLKVARERVAKAKTIEGVAVEVKEKAR